FMFASNINHLGVARLITGIGTGLVTGAATAAVVEMMTDGNWARGATFAALAFTLGASLGPTTSSLALRWTSHAHIWPFLVVIALVLLCLILLLKAPWPAGLGQRHPDFRLRKWRPTPIKVPRPLLGVFVFAASAICLAWSTGSLYSSLGPSMARELAGVSDLALAGLFAAGWQLVAGITQFAAQRQPLTRLILAGPLLLIMGLAAMASAVLLGAGWLFTLATVMAATGAGTTGVIATVTIARSAPPAERGGMTPALDLAAYLTMATVLLGLGSAGLGLAVRPGHGDDRNRRRHHRCDRHRHHCPLGTAGRARRHDLGVLSRRLPAHGHRGAGAGFCQRPAGHGQQHAGVHRADLTGRRRADVHPQAGSAVEPAPQEEAQDAAGNGRQQIAPACSDENGGYSADQIVVVQRQLQPFSLRHQHHRHDDG